MLAAMLAALAALLSSEGTQEEENEDEKKCEVLAVKVWINAFIPGELGSVTLPIPGEPGKTMLKVPWWAPGKCFYTDHRGYSADLDASTRMQQIVMLDVKSARIWSEARCGTTIEVFCDDGRVRQTGLAPTTGMRMVNISHPAPSVHTCELIGSAANPLVSGAPSIDYHGFLSHRHRGGSRSRRRLDARKGTGGLHGRSLTSSQHSKCMPRLMGVPAISCSECLLNQGRLPPASPTPCLDKSGAQQSLTARDEVPRDGARNLAGRRRVQLGKDASVPCAVSGDGCQ